MFNRKFGKPSILTGLIAILFPLIAIAQPVIEVEPDEIDFGVVELDDVETEALTISNTGDDPLVVSELETDNEIFSAGYAAIEDFEVEHFQFQRTDDYHPIIVQGITWDDEPPAPGDEVGVFVMLGNQCLGAEVIEDPGEQIGIAAWLSDDVLNERMEFRIWDPCTESEIRTAVELIRGPEVFQRGAFSVVILTAQGGCHRTGGGEIIVGLDLACDIPVHFEPEEDGRFRGTLTIHSDDPDNDEVEVDLVGIGGEWDNELPVIVEPTEDDLFRIIVNEIEEIEVLFAAEDPDGANDRLEWTVEDAGDLPGDQGDAWDFVEDDDAGVVFTWAVEEDIAREEPYCPVFRVTDPRDEFDEITLNIFVWNELPQPIPDQELIEDCERTILFDLDDLMDDDLGLEFLFSLPDNPDDPLRIEIIEDTNELTAQPVPDYCAPDPGMEVNTIVHTQYSFVAELNFNVIVHPLNDPPGEFNLLTPGDEIDIWAYDQGTLNFSWKEAQQNEYEIDSVEYWLVIKNDFSDDSLEFSPLIDNNFEITLPDILDGLNLSPESASRLLWYVAAEDDLATVIAENSPYRIYLTMSSVSDNDLSGIPGEFVLLPAFPNPFNSRTTINFGLPTPGSVEISLFDLNGKRISDLSGNAWYSAGYHRLEVNLKGVPAGSYMLNMGYDGKVLTQRLVLIK